MQGFTSSRTHMPCCATVSFEQQIKEGLRKKNSLIRQFLFLSLSLPANLCQEWSGEGARPWETFFSSWLAPSLTICGLISYLQAQGGWLLNSITSLLLLPPSCLLSVELSWATSSCKISVQFSAEALWEWIVSTLADFDWHSLKDKQSYTIGRGRYSLQCP